MAGKGNAWIFVTLGILVLITTVEVVLGIIKPEFMINEVLGTSILNHTFIILTVMKAYYIVFYFMHVKFEVKILRKVIVAPLILYAFYMSFIFLTEALAISESSL